MPKPATDITGKPGSCHRSATDATSLQHTTHAKHTNPSGHSACTGGGCHCDPSPPPSIDCLGQRFLAEQKLLKVPTLKTGGSAGPQLHHNNSHNGHADAALRSDCVAPDVVLTATSYQEHTWVENGGTTTTTKITKVQTNSMGIQVDLGLAKSDSKGSKRHLMARYNEEDEYDDVDDEDDDDDASHSDSGSDDTDCCSSQSDTTSTSSTQNRQEAGRVCDCCYCEVFGHGIPASAPTSRNYPEMRERLRLRLSQRKAQKNGGGGGCNASSDGRRSPPHSSPGASSVKSRSVEPGEKNDGRDIDELLSFINGTGSINSEKASKKREKKKKKKLEKQQQEKAVVPPPSAAAMTSNGKHQPPSQQSHSRNGSQIIDATLAAKAQGKADKSNKENSSSVPRAKSAANGKSAATTTAETNGQKAKASECKSERHASSNAVSGTTQDKVEHQQQLNQKRQQSSKDAMPLTNGRVHSHNKPAAEPNNKTATDNGIHHEGLNGHIELMSGDSKADKKSKESKQVKNARTKKKFDDGLSLDEIFMPKPEIDLENGEMDEYEKELEAFKRFCFNTKPLEKKEKVHVNIKDIFIKRRVNEN